MTEYKLTARERADAVIKANKEGDVSIDDLVRIALDDPAAFVELLSDCLPNDELEIAILRSLEEMETSRPGMTYVEMYWAFAAATEKALRN
jgi:hypothetical protein